MSESGLCWGGGGGAESESGLRGGRDEVSRLGEGGQRVRDERRRGVGNPSLGEGGGESEPGLNERGEAEFPCPG